MQHFQPKTKHKTVCKHILVLAFFHRCREVIIDTAIFLTVSRSRYCMSGWFRHCLTVQGYNKPNTNTPPPSPPSPPPPPPQKKKFLGEDALGLPYSRLLNANIFHNFPSPKHKILDRTRPAINKCTKVSRVHLQLGSKYTMLTHNGGFIV